MPLRNLLGLFVCRVFGRNHWKERCLILLWHNSKTDSGQILMRANTRLDQRWTRPPRKLWLLLLQHVLTSIVDPSKSDVLSRPSMVWAPHKPALIPPYGTKRSIVIVRVLLCNSNTDKYSTTHSRSITTTRSWAMIWKVATVDVWTPVVYPPGHVHKNAFWGAYDGNVHSQEGIPFELYLRICTSQLYKKIGF